MVQLPIGNTQVFANVIKSPRCPKCGEMMALRLIEPERPGFDLRTFECPKCFGTQTSVASISCEVIRGDRGPVGWCTPDLLRIRGRRLLRSGKKNPSAAEALLMRSLDAARQQEALSWDALSYEPCRTMASSRPPRRRFGPACFRETVSRKDLPQPTSSGPISNWESCARRRDRRLLPENRIRWKIRLRASGCSRGPSISRSPAQLFRNF
jgi:hypothetical protein